MKNKITLREHLERLDQNSPASKEQIDSLCRRMALKFREYGYVKSSYNQELMTEYVNMIFETQDYRCTHWLPVGKGELNGIWNRPQPKYRGWRADYVMYEIDHVHPVISGGGDEITNYQFLSANANQFTKCSLTYDDLLRRVDLSDSLKDRIRLVLKKREALFQSKKWANFIKKLNQCEKGA